MMLRIISSIVEKRACGEVMRMRCGVGVEAHPPVSSSFASRWYAQREKRDNNDSKDAHLQTPILPSSSFPFALWYVFLVLE